MLRIVHIVLPKYNVTALHIEAVVISEAIGREWYEVCRHRVPHFKMLILIDLFQAIFVVRSRKSDNLKAFKRESVGFF